MKLLYIGDVVGRSGRDAVTSQLPELRKELDLDFVICNGENAAGGFGITGKIAEELFASGVDVLTGGNHSWDQKEALSFIETEPRLLRPANYPPGTPGRGAASFTGPHGHKVVVVNVLGLVFMQPLDDPFRTVDRALETVRRGQNADFVLVDIHAEATSEKMAMGHFCDGRASLVVGSHSHVPTADTQILDGGTAYQTDAGMCGDYNSIIGMDKQEPLHRFLKKIPSGRWAPAEGEGTLCGVFVETDNDAKAVRAERVRLGGRLSQSKPS